MEHLDKAEEAIKGFFFSLRILLQYVIFYKKYIHRHFGREIFLLAKKGMLPSDKIISMNTCYVYITK